MRVGMGLQELAVLMLSTMSHSSTNNKSSTNHITNDHANEIVLPTLLVPIWVHKWCTLREGSPEAGIRLRQWAIPLLRTVVHSISTRKITLRTPLKMQFTVVT